MRFFKSIAVAALALSGHACAPSDTGETAPSFEERVEQATEDIAQPERSAEAEWLDDRFFDIGSRFDGFVGIAMHDLATGETVGFNGEEYFPQQSVSKLWVALTAFRMVDAGALDLAENRTIRFEDIAVFHSPIRKPVIARGSFTTDYADLVERAITESDNTANDLVLRRVGGPDAIRRQLSALGIEGIRFGPGERAMQSAIAGLEWDQSYARGKVFFEVREEVPDDVRARAFNAYATDPVDGAQPDAIALALARLADGRVLSDAMTSRYLELLGEVKSGPNRLKGAVPPGWSIGHKTGTGQVFDPDPPGGFAEQAGYNDVGILTAPDGSVYSVAVMIGRTARPVPERMDMMHRVVAAIVGYHEMKKVPEEAATAGGTSS